MFAAAAVALGFLLFPIVAIFARVSPADLVAQLSRAVVTDALVVSLKTSAIAQALVLLLGTPTAYLLATRRFRGRSLLVVLVELPLVLPPAVAGIGLIAAFGRFGLLGEQLNAFGIQLGLTQTAVVMAVAYVSSALRSAMRPCSAMSTTTTASVRLRRVQRSRTVRLIEVARKPCTMATSMFGRTARLITRPESADAPDPFGIVASIGSHGSTSIPCSHAAVRPEKAATGGMRRRAALSLKVGDSVSPAQT